MSVPTRRARVVTVLWREVTLFRWILADRLYSVAFMVDPLKQPELGKTGGPPTV